MSEVPEQEYKQKIQNNKTNSHKKPPARVAECESCLFFGLGVELGYLGHQMLQHEKFYMVVMAYVQCRLTINFRLIGPSLPVDREPLCKRKKSMQTPETKDVICLYNMQRKPPPPGGKWIGECTNYRRPLDYWIDKSIGFVIRWKIENEEQCLPTDYLFLYK